MDKETRADKKIRQLQELVRVLVVGIIGMTIIGAIAMNSYRVDIENLKAQKQDVIEQKGAEVSKSDSLQSELDSLHVLSWENVEYWIDTLDIKYPEVVKQQVLLETGALTSTICNENHNLFGMKEPRIRETKALGTKRGHAYYANYIESIKDYKLWQDNRYGGGDYYAFLKRVGYAEARHYIAALKNI